MNESKPIMQRKLEAIVGMMREGKWADALVSWGTFATSHSDLGATRLGLARELRDLGKKPGGGKHFSRNVRSLSRKS